MTRERLILLTGASAGQSIPLPGVLTIGRSPENALQLDDPQVSRRHAILEPGAEGTIVRDLGSGNGTYVGGRRVLDHRLSSGDIIRIGTQEMRFECGPEETTNA